MFGWLVIQHALYLLLQYFKMIYCLNIILRVFDIIIIIITSLLGYNCR